MTVSNHPTNATRGPTSGDRARFAWAIALSLAGHLAMLAGWSPAGSTGRPTAMTARLVGPPPVVERPPREDREALPQPAAPSLAKPPRPAAPGVMDRPSAADVAEAAEAATTAPAITPAPVAVDAPSAVAVPVPAADAAVVSASPSGDSLPAAGGAPVAVVPAPSALRASEAATGASAVAADLEAYWRSLARIALNYKRYPPLARERGWEGTVELTVVLLPRHPAPVIRVTRGSGFPLLDDQAREMMVRAIRRLPVPEALREARAEHLFPIRYTITD